jgi:holo-[acyl-carrier protein] synthase
VRFAAKEAVLKALGCGPEGEVSLKEIEVIRGERGEPHIRLRRRAQEVGDALGVTKLHVSLSHAETHCVAQVVAEGE